MITTNKKIVIHSMFNGKLVKGDVSDLREFSLYGKELMLIQWGSALFRDKECEIILKARVEDYPNRQVFAKLFPKYLEIVEQGRVMEEIHFAGLICLNDDEYIRQIINSNLDDIGFEKAICQYLQYSDTVYSQYLKSALLFEMDRQKIEGKRFEKILKSRKRKKKEKLKDQKSNLAN